MGTSRKSPLGCIVVLLALLPLALSGMGIYGWMTWAALPQDKRPAQMLQVWISCTAGGLVMAAALLWLGARILRDMDWKDQGN